MLYDFTVYAKGVAGRFFNQPDACGGIDHRASDHTTAGSTPNHNAGKSAASDSVLTKFFAMLLREYPIS
jgi:hypothetical protein